ncbi:hypothetical protein ALC57_03111 [Trachymyrmex cornetzi]|uniref:Uncharacterized protein n=1 Tax=Trachymyrmex cornetzi TaxID=471704 RepID=A0A151JMW6_9HYME|nr:hypothetical protein ALC57_03111 [Trachymyrmex cornetzi]
MVPYSEAKRLITAAVFEHDTIVYVKGREKQTWLWNLLLLHTPKIGRAKGVPSRTFARFFPSPPPKKEEEVRYWECPVENTMEHRAVRLLSRRYNLTSTGYKYLEIGINVGPPSYVEIALGDNRGHELWLSLETWKGLYEQRWNIYKMLCNEYKDNFISVGPLTVRVCTMNDATLVRLDSSSVRITMTETTLRRMFAFDGCIDVTFERLVRLVDTVDVKYTRFSNIASEDAIRNSSSFNGHQLVDCELLALVFNTHEKNPDVVICE